MHSDIFSMHYYLQINSKNLKNLQINLNNGAGTIHVYYYWETRGQDACHTDEGSISHSIYSVHLKWLTFRTRIAGSYSYNSSWEAFMMKYEHNVMLC